MASPTVRFISDLHFGSEASVIESIKEIMRELDKPDTYAILAGDLLEGVKQEYMFWNERMPNGEIRVWKGLASGGVLNSVELHSTIDKNGNMRGSWSSSSDDFQQ